MRSSTYFSYYLYCYYILLIVYWYSGSLKKQTKKWYTHIYTHTHTHTHTHTQRSASQGSLEGTFLRSLGSDLYSISENHLHKIRKIEEKESHYSHPPVAGRWKGRSKSGIHRTFWVSCQELLSLDGGSLRFLCKFLEFLHFLIPTQSAVVFDADSWLPQFSQKF